MNSVVQFKNGINTNDLNNSLEYICEIVDDERRENDDENLILEKSPSLQFHKRRRKYFHNIDMIDASFLAIEPKSGKQVIWNEIILNGNKLIDEDKFFLLINQLRMYNHPFLLRFYEAWVSQSSVERKLIFITERITSPSIREYIVHTNLFQRLHDKISWKKMTGQLISALQFLYDIGASHGDITNETVLQSNSTIKLDLGAIDLFPYLCPRKKFYNFGKLILEMCAYSHHDAHGVIQQNDVDIMFERVIDEDQKIFISNILNENYDDIEELAKEFKRKIGKFPVSLKILAGRKVVFNDVNSSNGIITIHCSYEDLLKSHFDHFDNETVIVHCKKRLPHDQSMKWRDFESSFVSLPKFLQDIHNGFYDIFPNTITASLSSDSLILLKDFRCPHSVNEADDVSDAGSVTSYLKINKSLDLDSISMENQEFFKELEVTEKIYSHHGEICAITVNEINELNESKKLIDLSFENQENGDRNLIDLNTPICSKKLKVINPCNETWNVLFENEITKFSLNDNIAGLELTEDLSPINF